MDFLSLASDSVSQYATRVAGVVKYLQYLGSREGTLHTVDT
jgi:hypothetical protein